MLLIRRTNVVLILLIGAACALSARDASTAKEAARLNNVGVALMNQHYMERAIETFDKSLQADPSLFLATTNKAIALLNVPDLPKAEELLKKAAAERPQEPRVWYLLGLLHEKQSKNEESVDDFRKVLQLDAADADSHFLLGNAYLKLRQYDNAIPEFEAALAIDPRYASAEFGLARTLQRLEKTDAAREHLRRFEYLTRNRISVPLTLNFGEQGRYAMPQDAITGEPAVAELGALKFLAQRLSGTKSTVLRGEQTAECVLDLNADGRDDIVATRSGKPFVQVFVNNGDGSFRQADAGDFGLLLRQGAVSCAVGDYDNDGHADLVIVTRDSIALLRNSGKGEFADATAGSGIVAKNDASGLTFVDYDHDGDLDLFIAGSARSGAAGSTANVLWRNNGNGTFTDVTAEAGVQVQAQASSVVLSDINNDRAVDLVLAGASGTPTLLSNQRDGKFVVSPLFTADVPASTGLAVLDFNKDGWMDIVVTHDGAPGLTLWKNMEGKSFERVPLPISGAKGAWGVTPVDVDNDGWIDLAVVVDSARGSEVRVLRNIGAQGFADVTSQIGLDKVRLQDARAILAADLDGDGDADLVVTQLHGAPVLLRNGGGDRNHSLRISLEGLADNRSAIGTKIEVFAGGLWQKFEVPGASGYRSQGPNRIEVGLGANQRADVVRMLWPTGVLQDEIDVPATKPANFIETDRRGSSCPTLFAWNGSRYQFVSDVIGAAVVGHWISPKERNVADPDEWVKIDGTQLADHDGFLSVRFGEPMEEVNYIDQLRLVAIDHPANREVYPDERFVSLPPFPSGAAVLTSQPRVPSGAWDDGGHDVRELLRAKDHEYVRDFSNLKFAGYAHTHRLTLDLGSWSPRNPLRMFMHGFIEYFTATSMYAAWQAGIQPVAPYLEAQMPNGAWVRVLDDMGFPAGLPRTIVVDLTGKLPAGTRKIRIVTNLQIYWDQILVDNGPHGDDELRRTELVLARASLAHRGYPQQVDGKTPGDLTYVYERASKTGPFAPQTGNYTSYGDVTPLLRSVDNRFVIFGTGEDIDAEFSTGSLPPLPEGWKRDYFFYANGFVKDMDFYEATPFTVAEMPFAGMSSYPYPQSEHYPDDADALEYRLEWNDRYQSGRQAPGYRFLYVPRTVGPEMPARNTR